ncbi:MAG: hypothetical protein KDI33_09220 [Halioglobus sp.]|nr:hypothetical protein [Halioglobus sp.]
MAVFWLLSNDGQANFQCEARDTGHAFELLARSMKYASFADLIADTGRGPADFQVALIETVPAEYDANGNLLLIDQQRENSITGAFREVFARRNG